MHFMLRRLDSYILRDLLRLALLTTTVLVTVIAFGAAIKPLATDRLLTAGQTAKYVVLAIVPMLQFALPFAAGFAGTLGLFRMTSDNEVLAAAVSGISYRRLLAPVLGLGVALALVMVLLTQWVIPRFWTVLERAIREDVTQIFQAAIARGEPFQLGDRQIFADRLIVEQNPAGTTADTRLVLRNVAYADLDEKGRIDKDVTAARAVVDVYRRPGVTYLKLAMADAVAFNPDAGILAGAELLDFKTIAIPSVLDDDARNLTRNELLALRRNPDTYGPVIRVRLRLADALRDHVLWEQVDERLRASGAVEMAGSGEEGPRYVVHASRLDDGSFAPAKGGQVEVTLVSGGAARRSFRAGTAVLQRRDTGPLDRLVFDLVLGECDVTDLAFPDAPNQRERVTLEGLVFTGLSADDLSRKSSADLLAIADRYAAGGDRTVIAAADRLRREIHDLGLEITGRMVKRYALSLTALLLLVLGSVLAMTLRGSQPLPIYLCAFLPSIADLLLISSGEHMVRDGSVLGGMSVMWVGNAVLTLMILIAYRVLARH